MSPVRSSFSKTSSRVNVPSGLHTAVVTQVNGDDVFVKIPRLTYEFQYGPVPYIGAAPFVGDTLFVGFIEGRQDDVVGIFPGQADSAGPIEPTWVIAAADATSELQQAADFLCDGTGDEFEFYEVFDYILDSDIGKGRIALSDGSFFFSDRLAVPDGLTLVFEGPSGQGPNLIWDDIDVSGNGLFEIGIGSKVELNRLKLSAGVFNDNTPNYVVYKNTGGTLTLNEVTLEATLIGGGTGTVSDVPDLLYSAADVTQLQRVTGDSETGGVTIDGGTYHITNSNIYADDDACSITTQASVGWITDNYLTSLDDLCLKVESDAGTFIRRNTFWMADYDTGATVVHLKGRALFDTNNFATVWFGFSEAGGDLLVEDTANVTIRDNQMGAGHGRIVIRDSDYVTVYRNFHNSPTGDVSIYAEGTTTPLEGLVIVENQEGAPDGGKMIEVVNARRPLIAHNEAETETSGSIWVVNCDAPIVEHNRIKTRFDDYRAIYVNGSDNAVVRNNRLFGNGYIDALLSDFILIEGNILATGESQTQTAGININGCANPRIFSNVYLPPWDGLGSSYNFGLRLAGGTTGALLYNNDFSLCQDDVLDLTADGLNEIGLHHIVVGADDPLTVGAGTQPYLWTKGGRIIDVVADAGVTPIGADIIMDVNVNGATIWTIPSEQPTIVDTSGVAIRAPATTNDFLKDGDIITVDVDQVGSTISGGELVTTVRVREIYVPSTGWINHTYVTGTTTAPVPSGGQTGDILVLFAYDQTFTWWTDPSGWTNQALHRQSFGPNSFGGGIWFRSWSSEPANYTLPRTADIAIMGLLRGVDTPGFFINQAVSALGNSSETVTLDPGALSVTPDDVMMGFVYAPVVESGLTMTDAGALGLTKISPGPTGGGDPSGHLYVGQPSSSISWGEPVGTMTAPGPHLELGVRLVAYTV